MLKVFGFLKKAVNFLTKRIWHIRIGKLEKRQGFLLKQLRIIILAIKGFNEDKCMLKASALTYYILFSVVPILALIFAVAKSFNFQKKLESDLLRDFKQYSEILNKAFDYADKMLQTAHGGILAVIGLLLLVYTLIMLLSSIEDSFNEIWEIRKGRTWLRRITDYLAIAAFAPVFLVMSSSITMFLQKEALSFESISWFHHLDAMVKIFLKGVSLLLLSGLFTFIYMSLPNTRVRFKSALIAGIVAAIAFDILQYAYINFQIGAVRYNRIYGSFAALPLFLIWVQYSWFIVLFCAELAFANQNVDHYELEHEIQNISIRYKRVMSLLVANHIAKNFESGNPPLRAEDIAHQLDLPIRLARIIVADFIETGLFSEVKTKKKKEIAYLPALALNQLTVKFILDKLDTKGVNELPINVHDHLESVKKVMDDIDRLVEEHKGDLLVKDLF